MESVGAGVVAPGDDGRFKVDTFEQFRLVKAGAVHFAIFIVSGGCVNDSAVCPLDPAAGVIHPPGLVVEAVRLDRPVRRTTAVRHAETEAFGAAVQVRKAQVECPWPALVTLFADHVFLENIGFVIKLGM